MDRQASRLPLALQSPAWREWRDAVAPGAVPGSVSSALCLSFLFFLLTDVFKPDSASDGVIQVSSPTVFPSSLPALSPRRSPPLIIDPSVIDLTTPPPASTLGKRRGPPINYDDTYVDDDGTVHLPPDEGRPKKRTRAPAAPSKGKGKAPAQAPPKPKSQLPPVRKVAPPPLPEPLNARFSDLTTARAHGLVSLHGP